ncbi:MAG: hypothetical protein ACI9SE_003356 [Neolewinella sp.]|jgi:hypothetical protein
MRRAGASTSARLLLKGVQQTCATKNGRLVSVLQGHSPDHRSGAPIRNELFLCLALSRWLRPLL